MEKKTIMLFSIRFTTLGKLFPKPMTDEKSVSGE